MYTTIHRPYSTSSAYILRSLVDPSLASKGEGMVYASLTDPVADLSSRDLRMECEVPENGAYILLIDDADEKTLELLRKKFDRSSATI
jgi:hypothetical protein